MGEQKRWHSWVIKRNRYDSVITYIREHVPEIDKYFYPMIKKEYQTKRGVITKDRPLYEGYLFVHYNDHDRVFHKMSAYPFVTTYAGLVDDDEIVCMQQAQGKLISEIKNSRFSPGDSVLLLEGPFKGFEGAVIGTEGGVVRVRIGAQILGQGMEMAFKEDSVERKTELQNIEIQDI